MHYLYRLVFQYYSIIHIIYRYINSKMRKLGCINLVKLFFKYIRFKLFLLGIV